MNSYTVLTNCPHLQTEEVIYYTNLNIKYDAFMYLELLHFYKWDRALQQNFSIISYIFKYMFNVLFTVQSHETCLFSENDNFLEGQSVRKSSGSAKSRHGACCNPFSCHAKYVTKGLRQYHQSI